MLQSLIQDVIYKLTYYQIYFLVMLYFLLMYFVLAPAFLQTCKFLERRKVLHKISSGQVSRKQVSTEIKRSVSSILVFGFSGIPIVYLIRTGHIVLLEDNLYNILFGVLLLSLWNELHFFVVHRLMHLPYFMKRVHYVHHQSKVPTVYSVYSFHWFEALLLSTVPLTIAPFVPLPALAFVFYPLASILLNFSGHCNYRFGNGRGSNWVFFATRHNEHHYKGKNNYGFATHYLDKIYKRINKSK
ncbi:MAG: sterol desaturase family protein [Hymenobacteraceae bacterium]|nr:sterol desaturase family protein [Hymenobacteraceae bacterium]